MKRPHSTNTLCAAATILLTIVALGSAGSGASSLSQDGPPAQAGTPATIPASVVTAAQKIATDPQVKALIEQHTGSTYYDWNSASGLFGDAVRLGVITQLEYDVAERAYGRGWTYSGD